MDFLSLSLRIAAAGSANYLPYGFDGDWTDAERALVAAAFAPHVPARVDSMFNEWRLWHYGGGKYIAQRATWTAGGFWADTAAELAEKISDYYAPREG